MTFSIKGVFRRTQAILRQAWLPITLVTVATMVLPVCAQDYIRAHMFDGPGLGISLSLDRLRAIVLVTMIGMYFLHAFHMGAVNELAIRIEAAKPLKAWQLARNAAINAVPVFVIDVLFHGGILAGAVLLLVPGLLFGVVFSVVTPAYICERKGLFEAFARSYRLTDGHRWQIFAAWLVIIVVVNVISACIALPDLSWIGGLIHRFFPDMTFVVFSRPPPVSPPIRVLALLVGTALKTLMIVFNAAVYLALRFDTTAPVDPRIEEVFE